MKVRYLVPLLFAVFVPSANTQDAQQRPAVQPNQSGVSDHEYALDDFPYREEFILEGARYQELGGEAAGLPALALPGARFIKSKDLTRTVKRIDSGLLLLDMDFVPADLPDRLQKEGYRLTKDGKLFDKEKQPVLMIMRAHVYAIYSDDEPMQRRNSYLQNALDLLVPQANAGNPYPLRCATWAWRRTYNGGFCRSIKAQTWADAWGPSGDGSCGPDRPHTRIEYIETRAHVSGAEDRDTCANCDSEYSRDNWNIGCFWPAFAGGRTSHYAHVKDGNIRGTATATSN